ncbi:MAG: metallophosphoesterase [Bacteroidales bacterium]
MYLIGDVHSNYQALEAVSHQWEPNQQQAIWALGDWMGGRQPLQVWEWIQRNQNHLHAVQGNHDRTLHPAQGERSLDYVTNDESRNKTWDDFRLLQDTGALDNFRDWSASRPLVLSPLEGVYMAHGSFWMNDFFRVVTEYSRQPDDYTRGCRSLSTFLQNGFSHYPEQVHVNKAVQPRVMITGHTHQQKVWQRDDGGTWRELGMLPEAQREYFFQGQSLSYQVEIQLSAEQPVWINPGSVGEPRDIDDGVRRWAKYLCLDFNEDTLIIRFHWVVY